MDNINPRRKVAFPKGDKPDKALMPLRCPSSDHDKRTGFPLRFGLGEDKDNLLEKRLIQNMRLSDIDKLVDETCDCEQGKLSDPRKSAGRILGGISENDAPTREAKERTSARGTRGTTPDHDMSLVTAMAARLRQAEQTTASLRDEMKKKDQLIAQLRLDIEKIITESSKVREDTARPSDLAMMKEHNSKLRELLKRADVENKNIQEENEAMKKFLQDYGLKWVGESKDSEPDRKVRNKELLLEGGDWHPSVAHGEEVISDLNSQAGIEALGVPFDAARILANVKQLNILAEEGCKEIVRGSDGIRRLQEKSMVLPPTPIPISKSPYHASARTLVVPLAHGDATRCRSATPSTATASSRVAARSGPTRCPSAVCWWGT